jgi:glycosyltransferase involved in cell wall biosynthesis
MQQRTWAILTGEYPPQLGGVSDYTRLVARRLAAAGDAVHVFAPTVVGHDDVSATDAGVSVHRLPDHFGRRGLRWLGEQLDRLPRPLRVLVQYVPHAYGHRAMNVWLPLWLWRHRKLVDIDLMFHEVAFGFERGQPWKHYILAAVQLPMSGLAARAAQRIFVSIPAWDDRLRRFVGPAKPITWLPVPSNFEAPVTAAERQAVRTRLGVGDEQLLLGHFGTFNPKISNLLTAIVLPELARRGGRCLLMGRGSDHICRHMSDRHAELACRLHGTGVLPASDLASHVAACDLLVQPYPDGISTRRSSSMGALSLGVPIVTCSGHSTEPIWRPSGAVALADAPSPAAMIELTEHLLADPTARAEMGRRAASLYDARFDIRHLIASLRAAPESPRPAQDIGAANRSRWAGSTDKALSATQSSELR